MSEKSNIQCWDCSYFDDDNNRCTFLGKKTTQNTKCFAELYQLVPICENKRTCNSCQYLSNGCKGDRTAPPKKLQIYLHEGQMKVLESKAQYIAALCGAQSGKTEMMPMVMHKEMLKMGSGDALAVSSTFPLMDKKLVPIYRKYFEEYLHIGKWQEQKKKLIIKSGDDFEYTIFFGSAKNPDSLESATAKVAHLDEAGQDDFTLDGYEAVLRRVSGNNGRIYFTTTLYNFGWLKSEVYDRWLAGDEDYDVIQWDSNIRPGYSKTVWNDRKRKMPPWKFDMQMRGVYSRPAGMIYNMFDDKIHVVKPFPIHPSWNWKLAIDPGAVNTAVGWFVEDAGTKKYYLVYSSLEGNMTTKEHALKVKERPEYSRIVWASGGAGNEQQFRDDWTAEGIHVREPGIRDVEAGIDKVITLLKEGNLFIFDTPENRWVITEFQTYSRKLDEKGASTDRIKDKHKYHGMDMVRYFAVDTGGYGDYSEEIYSQPIHIPTMNLDTNILRNDGNIPEFY